MTENTPTSPAMLKREALRLAHLPVDGDWPEAATAAELAAWQYPCDYTLPKESRKKPLRQQRDFSQLAKSDIDAGKLPTVPVIRNVSVMTEAIEYKATMFNGLPVSSRFGREVHPVKVQKPTTKPAEVQAIDRRACAAWLHAIGEKNPSEYVRAWLGPEWKKEAPKASDGNSTSDWKATARTIGEQWMLAQEKTTGERPTIKKIADHVADELSTRNIRGPRGKYPDAETIRREALTGITGRKKGDNLRR